MPFWCPYGQRIYWWGSRGITVALQCLWSRPNGSWFGRQRLRRRISTYWLPNFRRGGREMIWVSSSDCSDRPKDKVLSRSLLASHKRSGRIRRWICYLQLCLGENDYGISHSLFYLNVGLYNLLNLMTACSSIGRQGRSSYANRLGIPQPSWAREWGGHAYNNEGGTT